MKPTHAFHKFHTVINMLGIFLLLMTMRLGRAGWTWLLLFVAVIFLLENFFKFRESQKLNPYYLMILSPALLIFYSTPGDFRIRVACFFLFAYIINIAHHVTRRRIKFSLMHSKPAMIWLISFLLFALASFIMFVQGIQLSGDEPHFIMVSQSIVEDGDFDLKNNIIEKTYYKYLPVDIHFHGGITNGKYLSFHMPGVSLLLVPFYAIFNLLEGLIPASLYFRLVASILNAFFAFALFYILKITFPGKDITPVWLLSLILFPVFFHAVHIFPEMPAATLMMAAYVFAFSEKRSYFWAGFFLSLTLWFHVKYYPAIGIMAMIILFRILREEGKKKNLFSFFITPLVNVIMLVIFSSQLYHTISPTGIFPRQDFLAPPLLLRIKVFFAYFLDQRDGLLFYNPLLFLAFLGLRNKIKNQNILLWISVPYIVFHALTTVRGAYSPAGRPLVFVSWIFIIFLIHFYYQHDSEKPRYIFRLLSGFGFFILCWLIYYPLFMYQPVVSSTVERSSTLLKFMGSNLIDLSALFPSFLTSPPDFHTANIFWIIGISLVLIVYYLRIPVFSVSKNQKMVLSGLMVLLLGLLFCFFPHVHLVPGNRFSDEKISLYNNSGNFRYIESRKGFNILAGNTYQVFIESDPVRNGGLTFQFQNTEVVDVRIFNKNRLLFTSRKRGNEGFFIHFSRLKTLRIKSKTVIPIEIITSTRETRAFLFLQIK